GLGGADTRPDGEAEEGRQQRGEGLSRAISGHFSKNSQVLRRLIGLFRRHHVRLELSGCADRPIMYHTARWGRRRDSWVGIRWRRPFWPPPSSFFLVTPQHKLKTCSGRSRTRSDSSRARARSPCMRPPTTRLAAM